MKKYFLATIKNNTQVNGDVNCDDYNFFNSTLKKHCENPNKAFYTTNLYDLLVHIEYELCPSNCIDFIDYSETFFSIYNIMCYNTKDKRWYLLKKHSITNTYIQCLSSQYNKIVIDDDTNISINVDSVLAEFNIDFDIYNNKMSQLYENLYEALTIFDKGYLSFNMLKIDVYKTNNNIQFGNNINEDIVFKKQILCNLVVNNSMSLLLKVPTSNNSKNQYYENYGFFIVKNGSDVIINNIESYDLLNSSINYTEYDVFCDLKGNTIFE